MSWWNCVASLTPMAAYDAARLDGALLLDGVGSNHLSSTGALVASDFALKTVAGNGNPFNFASPISMPTAGLVVGFVKVTHRWVTFAQNTVGGVYLMHYANDGNWYSSNTASVAHGVMPNVFGTAVFAALLKGPSTSQLYVNGVAIGSPVANSYIPPQIDKIGHVGNGNEYNLQVTDSFMAAGFWSGTATQADLVVLEAAVRTELVGQPASCRGFRSETGRLNTASAEAMTQSGVVNRFRGQTLGMLNPYFGGAGRITGSIKITPNLPIHRRLRLFHEATGILIAEAWSDATTGAYSFTHLDPTQTYTVVGFDYTQAYRAVIADRVVPELMP